MKVRFSQIPEESSKVKVVKKTKTVNRNYSDFVDSDEEDDEEEEITDEEKKEHTLMFLIHFKELGLSISPFRINSIEKVFRFFETPKPCFKYGIVLNEGFEPREVFYEKEEIRDQKYEEMLDLLEKNGVKVFRI